MIKKTWLSSYNILKKTVYLGKAKSLYLFDYIRELYF